MIEINVSIITEDPWEFDVALYEKGAPLGEYVVHMTAEDYEHYGVEAAPRELIEATFRFLLEREDAEMILAEFGLSEVEKYFPEYPDVVPDYL
jgi:hypothetical protein